MLDLEYVLYQSNVMYKLKKFFKKFIIICHGFSALLCFNTSSKNLVADINFGYSYKYLSDLSTMHYGIYEEANLQLAFTKDFMIIISQHAAKNMVDRANIEFYQTGNSALMDDGLVGASITPATWAGTSYIRWIISAGSRTFILSNQFIKKVIFTGLTLGIFYENFLFEPSIDSFIEIDALNDVSEHSMYMLHNIEQSRNCGNMLGASCGYYEIRNKSIIEARIHTLLRMRRYDMVIGEAGAADKTLFCFPFKRTSTFFYQGFQTSIFFEFSCKLMKKIKSGLWAVCGCSFVYVQDDTFANQSYKSDVLLDVSTGEDQGRVMIMKNQFECPIFTNASEFSIYIGFAKYIKITQMR